MAIVLVLEDDPGLQFVLRDALDRAGHVVIFMTGSGLFPKGELFGISQNARWVLRKPVDITELTTMIAHATGKEVAIADVV